MTDTRRRTRGAGSVFRDKNGTWHYRRELDRDPATGRPRRIEAKGRTKAEARTRFDAKAAEMERTGLMPGAKSPLLKDYCERWLADYRTRVKPTTYRTRAGRIRACCEVIGHVRLKDLTAEHIRLCTRTLGARLASSTLKDHFTSLKMVLDQAELEELIPIDPCRRGRPPRVERRVVDVLGPRPAEAHDRGGGVDAAGQARQTPVGRRSGDVGPAVRAGVRDRHEGGRAIRAHALRTGIEGRPAWHQRAAADPTLRQAGRGRDTQLAGGNAHHRHPMADHAEDAGSTTVRANQHPVVEPIVGLDQGEQHRHARLRVHLRPRQPRMQQHGALPVDEGAEGGGPAAGQDPFRPPLDGDDGRRANMPDDARIAVMGHTSMQMTMRYTHRDAASLGRLMGRRHTRPRRR